MSRRFRGMCNLIISNSDGNRRVFAWFGLVVTLRWRADDYWLIRNVVSYRPLQPSRVLVEDLISEM